MTADDQLELYVEMTDRMCDRVCKQIDPPERSHILQSMTGMCLLRYTMCLATTPADLKAATSEIQLALQACVVARAVANKVRASAEQLPGMEVIRQGTLDFVALVEAGRFPQIKSTQTVVSEVLAELYPELDVTAMLNKAIKPNKDAS